MDQNKRDENCLRAAFDVARKSRDAGDHPFGAILADADGHILMEQANGYTIEGNDRTAHAERLLASRAARDLPLSVLAGCTLYSSAEPCAMCAGALLQARAARLVYGAHDPKAGAVESRFRLLSDPRLNHRVEIISGVLAEKSQNLLRQFFEERR